MCCWNYTVNFHCFEVNHWRPRVVMVPTLSSLAAPEVVIKTTSGAASDDKVGLMITTGAAGAGFILYMRPANGRRCYSATLSLIGWAHKENDPCSMKCIFVWTQVVNKLLLLLGMAKLVLWVKSILFYQLFSPKNGQKMTHYSSSMKRKYGMSQFCPFRSNQYFTIVNVKMSLSFCM